ncbi:MAG: fibronectin type III domain-containing protein, partial [Actinomycetes bacterium]
TAIQFRDLAAGTPLTFTVTATNSAGEGSASGASTAIAPVAPPTTPSDVTAIGRDASALVTWTASAGNGDDEITYHVSGGGRECETTSTQCLVSGLVNGGSSYRFKVYATNSAGWSYEYSALSNAVRVSGLPSAPAGLRFTTDYPYASTFSSTGVAYAVVSAAPFDGGSWITGYTITAHNSSNPDVADRSVSTYAGVPVPFADLIEGDQYVFTAAATNANGQGASTTPTAPFTWARRPDAPSRVSASAADASASVSFVSPPSHGSNISEYKVYSFDTTTQQAGPTATGTESPLTVDGLTNGDAYTFSVKARNGLGESPAGTSSAVTPAGRPAVAAVSASLRPVSDGKRWARVNFSWNPAGARATAYTLIAEDQTDGTVREFNYGLSSDFTSGEASHIHYFGNDSNELAWGHEFKFRVVVRSALGASAQSDLSNAVTPIKKPAGPSATATRRPGGALISIDAPNNGGSAITGYTVRVSKSVRDSSDVRGWGFSQFSLVKTIEVGSNDNQIEVNELTSDAIYRFEVCATNEAGDGCDYAYSSAATRVDADGVSVMCCLLAAVLPSTPTIQGVTRGDGSATVVVNKPAANGSAVTGYEVFAYDHTGAEAGSAKITVADPYGSASTASATISGLTGGETYTFKATATNAVGTSELSSASDPVTLRVVPDAAPAPQASAQTGDGSITVGVDTPIDGASVASFQVQFDARFASPSTFTWPTATAFAGCGKRVEEGIVREGWAYSDFGNPCRLAASASGSITQDGLINGGPYGVRVRALNSDGVAGPWKTLPGEVTPGAVPVGTSATAAASTDVDHPNAVDVSWAAPNTRGSAISRVRVTSSPEGKTCEVDGSATGCTIDDLTPGTSYTFSVAWTNGFGDSAALVTEAASPTGSVDAPTGVIAEAAGQQGNSIYGAIVDVSWDAPENKRGLDLSGYIVVARDLTNQGEISLWANASSRTARFDDLIVGRRYQFTVQAVYSNGWHIPSHASAVVVPFGRPDEPSYTALAGTGSATV